MDILKRAHEITYGRREEKERQYGPFEEGMIKAANIASEMLNKEITPRDMYICLIALKFSRAAYSYKEDNFLDIMSYLGSLNDYLNKQKNERA